jgi:lipopolysaccharide/colanic/teichoic acid biosynthesis glycosyltransferase
MNEYCVMRQNGNHREGNTMITPEAVMAQGEQTARKEYYIEPVVPARKPLYTVCKRAFDIVAALAAGLVLLLPLCVIAVLIRLDSEGPALFKQERLGKNGKSFYMYKFRSMRLDAEKDGPKWAEQDDDRCTRLGKFLRKCRLDELPQLWNILVGDMSIVGPRPERSYFYDEFETYIHGFRNRLAVQPGLTGLAQVNGGYDLEPEEKIVFDMRYIAERSAILDLKIIFRTVALVFTHEGAR